MNLFARQRRALRNSPRRVLKNRSKTAFPLVALILCALTWSVTDPQPVVGDAQPAAQEAPPSRDVPAARDALSAQQAGPAKAAEPAGDAQPENGWSFDDTEEAEPTLLELVRDDAWDLGFFAAFVALALVSFFRKSAPLKTVTLVASVLYLGVYKSRLMSVVNVFGALTGNLPIFSYNITWYAFAGFTVVTTLLWGRLYCGRICAFGALTQLIDQIVPARFRVEVPSALEQRAGYIKYGILFAAIGYYLVTREIGFYRYIEPFWMFTFQASTLLWIGLGVLLLASVFVRNLYCRFLCPLGAALGLVSTLTLFRIKRWSECNTCQLCEKACEWGAIRKRRIIMSECVRCDDCERLYDDHARCPHWLLEIKRRTRGAGAPGPAPAPPQPAAPRDRS